MTKTTVYNLLKIAIAFMAIMLVYLFNTEDQVNLNTAIVIESIIVSIALGWRLFFIEEIEQGI